MPLRGRAFVPLWSGLLPGYERELDSWHTIEHMPERLGVPGFLRGRRYIKHNASDHSMFILYEGAHIATFRSPGLLARLNEPTEWSKRVQPALVNFIRGPCQTLVSLGDGIGGALVAIRIAGAITDTVQAGRSLVNEAPWIAHQHGVTAVHIGQHVPDRTETEESRLRPSTEASSFSFVVLIEGIGVPELDEISPEITSRLRKASSGTCDAGSYRLAYLLEAPA